ERDPELAEGDAGAMSRGLPPGLRRLAQSRSVRSIHAAHAESELPRLTAATVESKVCLRRIEGAGTGPDAVRRPAQSLQPGGSGIGVDSELDTAEERRLRLLRGSALLRRLFFVCRR